jgi:2-oxoisovalerate dehydrogenase E2 component (dihydrolipoyl transacylase)
MTIFYLPDLGEGLAEAIIHEWHIKVGDVIKIDQLMVSVETAKSIVEIPSPFAGKVVQLFSPSGATLKTGEALLDIETDQQTATVAGKLESSDIVLEEENFDIVPTQTISSHSWTSKADKISGLRLSMAKNMQKARQEVLQATIFDSANIAQWFDKNQTIQQDITATIIQAICKACKKEPALNCWYDGRTQKRLLQDKVNLGIALDTPEGLLVPVIKDAEKKNSEELRTVINQYKEKNLSPELFQEATITLSNIGTLAGTFGTPIVMPPTVAILAVGKIDKAQHQLPLSLSFDHRVVTGGEAARFLAALIAAL